mgnify:FL=1
MTPAHLVTYAAAVIGLLIYLNHPVLVGLAILTIVTAALEYHYPAR